jgi:hypothetical protein
LAWAFAEQGYPAALRLADDGPALAPDALCVLAELHAIAGPRVAVAANGAGYCHFREPWLKARALWPGYLAAGDDPGAVALWYGRLGWPPLPPEPDFAEAVLWNTLGLVRLGPEHRWARDEAQLDALLHGQREALLRHRRAADALAGSLTLIEALRLLRQVDAAALLSGVAVAPIAASGFYPDCWSHPVATLSLPATFALRELTLDVVAAQHLPPDASLELSLNGQLAAVATLDPGESLMLTALAPARLDGLEKRIVARCSVALAPCEVGFNDDRRKLGFLLRELTIADAAGARLTLSGAELLGGGRPAG